MRILCALCLLSFLQPSLSFAPPLQRRYSSQLHDAAATTVVDDFLRNQVKKELLQLLKSTDTGLDPVLADPVTKEPILIEAKVSSAFSTNFAPRTKYILTSANNTYTGSSDSYLDLLEATMNDNEENDDTTTSSIAQNFFPLIPPPIRSALATAGFPVGSKYVPMRDLFTSPAVSYAYERGWRQGFRRAGFPGPDKEAQLAMEYFERPMANSVSRVLVDMSCATGLFTRRFAASGKYKRVLGCDYSPSMLQEAGRRIRSEPSLRNISTKLDLVRLDVGQIPMQDSSIDALHAGAAMHCWPDLPAAVSEIYRVLKPGGRYFATTFLSSYFGTLQRSEGGATGPSRQAFQYFASIQQLRSLLEESGGFEHEKIHIEALGNACVVIRCEK